MTGDVSDSITEASTSTQPAVHKHLHFCFDLCQKYVLTYLNHLQGKKTASPLSSSVPFSPLHSSMSPFPNPPGRRLIPESTPRPSFTPMTNLHAPSSSPGAALHPLSHLFLSSPVPIHIVTPRQPRLKRALASFLDLAPKEESPPLTQATADTHGHPIPWPVLFHERASPLVSRLLGSPPVAFIDPSTQNVTRRYCMTPLVPCCYCFPWTMAIRDVKNNTYF